MFNLCMQTHAHYSKDHRWSGEVQNASMQHAVRRDLVQHPAHSHPRLAHEKCASAMSFSTYVRATSLVIWMANGRALLIRQPYPGCPSLSFTRGTSLEKHILDEHANSIGEPVSRLSSFLQPSRAPFHPAILSLPPLPYKLTTQGSAIIPPVPGTTRQNTQHTLRAASSLTSIPSSPSKRRPRLQDRDMSVALDAMHVDRLDTPPSSPTIAFADLPRIGCDLYNLTDKPEDQALLQSMYSVQPVMNPWIDVGRPQAIIDLTLPGYIPRPPPASILYDAFVVLNNLQNVVEEDADEPHGQTASLPPTQGSDPAIATPEKKKNVPNATS